MGVPRELSTNEEILRKSVPVVSGNQTGFLGTLDFGYIEETKDKIKKSSQKAFGTPCKIPMESLRDH